jgi:uncharacterized OB-fold protein
MKKVPFQKGLFEEANGEPALIGSKCGACGQVLFPPKPLCLNCLSTDVKPIRLSRDGKLYTFTTVHMASEHFPPPYTIGWIELPESIRIFSQLRGWQEHPLKIGMEMRMYIETLWQEEDREVIGFVFRPITGETQR